MSLNNFKSADEENDLTSQQSWFLPYANMMFLIAGFFAVMYTSLSVRQDQPITNHVGHQELIVKLAQQQKIIESMSLEADKLQQRVKFRQNIFNETSDSSSVLIAENKALENELTKLQEEQSKFQQQLQIELAEKQKLTEQIRLAEYQKIAEQNLRDKKEQEIKRKEMMLKTKDSQISQSNENIQYTKNIVETQEAEIAQLRAQLGAANAEIASLPQNLMFLLKWNSPQDLDLTVTDPNGRKFDFKRRNIASDASGGGTELWQTDNFQTGTYRLKVTYNPGPVGSQQSANFVIKADSSRDSKETLSHTLDATNRVKEILVKVNEKGQISFNP